MSEAIRYCAFGDSLTVGTGDNTGRGFAGRYRDYAQEVLKRPVTLRNAGTKGATSGELLQFLRNEGELRRGLGSAGIVTLTAGGNDLIRAAQPYIAGRDTAVLKNSLRAYGSNLRQMVRWIQHSTPAGSAGPLIILIGLYNPIPMLPEAEFWIKRFNTATAKMQSDSVRYVGIYDAFKGSESRLVSSDLFHPNTEGYKVIGAQIARTVKLTSYSNKWN
ncbi:GDSL-type esterase/lipase family protein [Paenibacillus sp. FJAT-26967]|uniref:GDSL-type esterase/lipase family protein n=1 Tax=Paenibacillus sp. FJAT-26967 TaxID=1729690 RepID=UPI000837F59F|nr:GDSL-type esterase/lipase family protein [Paenibacillus sp. FJAT-26967]